MATSSPRTRPIPTPSDPAPFRDRPVGIWIDTRDALIIRLKEKENEVKTVKMDMARHKRILKAKHHGVRAGGGVVSSEKHEQSRLDEERRRYLGEVMDAIGGAQRIVVFGPASMKNELGKVLRADARWRNSQVDLFTADRMTTNQRIAWVKRYFVR